jgi:hypothetical protein
LLFATDEDFNNRILRGLQRKFTDLDVVRLQDQDLADRSDPAVLKWCTQQNRILLTHDVNTMTRYAYKKIHKQESVPGVIAVHQKCPIGRALEDIMLLISALKPAEFKNRIIHVPLK